VQARIFSGGWVADFSGGSGHGFCDSQRNGLLYSKAARGAALVSVLGIVGHKCFVLRLHLHGEGLGEFET
jgi:hypothetical protein